MDAAMQRKMIAMKSLFMPKVVEHRCEECKHMLSHRDFLSYWDGDQKLEHEFAVPRICENCAEKADLCDHV